jgi:hypothetical protein
MNAASELKGWWAYEVDSKQIMLYDPDQNF